MEKILLFSSSSATHTASQVKVARPFLSPIFVTRPGTRTLSFSVIKPRRFSIYASREENDFRSKLTEADLMELKFGRMLGEDPKLTMAKILGRKMNPDASYLEIEKNFYKNKGKLVEIKEVPFNMPENSGSANFKNKLNMVRPVPKDGVKVGDSNNESLVDIQRPRRPSGSTVSNGLSLENMKRPENPSGEIVSGVAKSSVPNVSLRKPSVYVEEEDENAAVRNGLSLENMKRPKKPGRGTVSGVAESSVPNIALRKPSVYAEEEKDETAASFTVSGTAKSSVPNVILRKPSVYNEEDDEITASFKMKVKPNLTLKMRTDKVKENFGSMTLLQRPEQVNASNDNGDQMHSDEDDGKATYIVRGSSMLHESAQNTTRPTYKVKTEDAGSNKTDQLLENQEEKVSQLTVSHKPKLLSKKNILKSNPASPSGEMAFVTEKPLKVSDKASAGISTEGNTGSGVQSLEPNDFGIDNGNGASDLLAEGLVDSSLSVEAALQGKPLRLDQPVKAMSSSSNEEIPTNPEASTEDAKTLNQSEMSELEEHEETDWIRAEQHCRSGHRIEVELIGCSTRGFAVSFGSLMGFLPYRNLTSKWKFFAFPSWLRNKGLDPSKYRQSLGIGGSFEYPDSDGPLALSPQSDVDQITEAEVTIDMEFEDLMKIYDQEKTRFLSTFVGQLIKVNILSVNRASRKLIFSLKPKEKEEMVEKKRNLMARLSIGDVVKCCITKITYFGIFVEVEGVPALIHQTEVSWDATLNPASCFKIGQIVEAKVHELDFSLQRIFLSLKEIKPDPMIEALESVFGDSNDLGGRYNYVQADTEWDDVDSLIKELERIDGVQTVTKGRFFLSPGLAPTFQVYMASVFENQYKLLARAGNKAQEVMVEASLGAEEMRTAIMSCASRVV